MCNLLLFLLYAQYSWNFMQNSKFNFKHEFFLPALTFHDLKTLRRMIKLKRKYFNCFHISSFSRESSLWNHSWTLIEKDCLVQHWSYYAEQYNKLYSNSRDLLFFFFLLLSIRQLKNVNNFAPNFPSPHTPKRVCTTDKYNSLQRNNKYVSEEQFRYCECETMAFLRSYYCHCNLIYG